MGFDELIKPENKGTKAYEAALDYVRKPQGKAEGGLVTKGMAEGGIVSNPSALSEQTGRALRMEPKHKPEHTLPHNPFKEKEAQGYNFDIPKMMWWGMLSKLGVEVNITNKDLNPRTIAATKKAVGKGDSVTSYKQYGDRVHTEQKKSYIAGADTVKQAVSFLENLSKTPEKLVEYMKDDDMTAAFVLGRVKFDDAGRSVGERWKWNYKNDMMGAATPFVAGRAVLGHVMPGPGEGPIMDISLSDEPDIKEEPTTARINRGRIPKMLPAPLSTDTPKVQLAENTGAQ
jgi:hypothetical protein